MRILAALGVAVCLAQTPLAKAEVPSSLDLIEAKSELERVERLVREGGLAPAKLEEAKSALVEAEDRAILTRTLYGPVSIEQLTDVMNHQMLGAAKRLLDRQQDRVTRHRHLVEEGLLPRLSLTAHLEELDARRRTLEEAESRVRFWNELLAMARAEEARQAALEAEQLAGLKDSDENGIISPAQFKRLATEFVKTFGRTLPVSAKGETALHRSMGFNHVGRVDVALSPDSAEGKWLRSWLSSAAVPFIAFRAAVRGQATGAHIHIGAPSPRMRITD